MKHPTRILLAVLVSPLAVLIPLGFFAATEPWIFPNIGYGLGIWFMVAIFAVPIAYVAVGTVGLGAHFILMRRGIWRIWPYVVLASAISIIPGAIVLISGATGDDRIYPMLFLACSVAVSLVFGAIVTGSTGKGERNVQNAA